MKKVVLKAATERDFFRRGKALAQLADQGKALPEERTLSFEDPAELLRLLTASRLDVLRTVQDLPGSITVIANRLQRDRSAVKRDVTLLANAGMVTIEAKVLPGHGRMKEVRAAARHFRLEAVLI